MADISSIVTVSIQIPVDLISQWVVLMRIHVIRLGTRDMRGTTDHKITVFAVTAIVGLADSVYVVGLVVAVPFESGHFSFLVSVIGYWVRIYNIVDAECCAGAR